MDRDEGTVGDLAAEIGQALTAIHSILARLLREADLTDQECDFYLKDLEAVSRLANLLDPNL